MKQIFNELLRSSNREGVDELINHLEQSGFYESPCSSQYHLCVAGGLVIHSINVFNHAKKLANAWGVHPEEIIIPSLLHDIGKAGFNGKPGYVDNILKSGKKSDAKPYETNKNLISMPHQDLSLLIASKYIELTEDEMIAIKYHNGLYTPDGRDINGKENPVMLIVHFADLWCSRVVEE